MKLSGEAMTPFLVRLLEISLNNAAIPSDWKKTIAVPIYKRGDRSTDANYIAGYLRQIWDKKDWLYEGQHEFRPGYICESQFITVCQYMDSLKEGVGIEANIIDISTAFDLVPHDRLLTKLAAPSVDSSVVF